MVKILRRPGRPRKGKDGLNHKSTYIMMRTKEKKMSGSKLNGPLLNEVNFKAKLKHDKKISGIPFVKVYNDISQECLPHKIVYIKKFGCHITLNQQNLKVLLDDKIMNQKVYVKLVRNNFETEVKQSKKNKIFSVNSKVRTFVKPVNKLKKMRASRQKPKKNNIISMKTEDLPTAKQQKIIHSPMSLRKNRSSPNKSKVNITPVLKKSPTKAVTNEKNVNTGSLKKVSSGFKKTDVVSSTALKNSPRRSLRRRGRPSKLSSAKQLRNTSIIRKSSRKNSSARKNLSAKFSESKESSQDQTELNEPIANVTKIVHRINRSKETEDVTSIEDNTKFSKKESVKPLPASKRKSLIQSTEETVKSSEVHTTSSTKKYCTRLRKERLHTKNKIEKQISKEIIDTDHEVIEVDQDIDEHTSLNMDRENIRESLQPISLVSINSESDEELAKSPEPERDINKILERSRRPSKSKKRNSLDTSLLERRSLQSEFSDNDSEDNVESINFTNISSDDESIKCSLEENPTAMLKMNIEEGTEVHRADSDTEDIENIENDEDIVESEDIAEIEDSDGSFQQCSEHLIETDDLDESQSSTQKIAKYENKIKVAAGQELSSDENEIEESMDCTSGDIDENATIISKTSKKREKRKPGLPFKIRFNKKFNYPQGKTCPICFTDTDSNVNYEIHMLSHIQHRKPVIKLYRFSLPNHFIITNENCDKYLKPKIVTDTLKEMRNLVNKYAPEATDLVMEQSEEQNSTKSNQANVSKSTDYDTNDVDDIGSKEPDAEEMDDGRLKKTECQINDEEDDVSKLYEENDDVSKLYEENDDKSTDENEGDSNEKEEEVNECVAVEEKEVNECEAVERVEENVDSEDNKLKSAALENINEDIENEPLFGDCTDSISSNNTGIIEFGQTVCTSKEYDSDCTDIIDDLEDVVKDNCSNQTNTKDRLQKSDEDESMPENEDKCDEGNCEDDETNGSNENCGDEEERGGSKAVEKDKNESPDETRQNENENLIEEMATIENYRGSDVEEVENISANKKGNFDVSQSTIEEALQEGSNSEFSEDMLTCIINKHTEVETVLRDDDYHESESEIDGHGINSSKGNRIGGKLGKEESSDENEDVHDQETLSYVIIKTGDNGLTIKKEDKENSSDESEEEDNEKEFDKKHLIKNKLLNNKQEILNVKYKEKETPNIITDGNETDVNRDNEIEMAYDTEMDLKVSNVTEEEILSSEGETENECTNDLEKMNDKEKEVNNKIEENHKGIFSCEYMANDENFTDLQVPYAPNDKFDSKCATDITKNDMLETDKSKALNVLDARKINQEKEFAGEDSEMISILRNIESALENCDGKNQETNIVKTLNIQMTDIDLVNILCVDESPPSSSPKRKRTDSISSKHESQCKRVRFSKEKSVKSGDNSVYIENVEIDEEDTFI